MSDGCPGIVRGFVCGRELSDGGNVWAEIVRVGKFPEWNCLEGNVREELTSVECRDPPCRITSLYVQWIRFVTPWLTHRQTHGHRNRQLLIGYTISSASRTKNTPVLGFFCANLKITRE